MANDKEMSNAQGMWIKIAEPMAEGFLPIVFFISLRRVETKGSNRFLCSQGAKSHQYPTSLIVILQMCFQSLNENNLKGFCVIGYGPNIEQPKNRV